MYGENTCEKGFEVDEIAIKVLDTLFDLCEGESYAILEADEITSRIPNHAFATDELAEILSSFAVDGLVDMKYADNKEFCIAMRTKGRTLIKQSRERLQHLIDENPEVIAYREGIRAAEQDRAERRALEEEKARLLHEQEEKLAEAKESLDSAVTKKEKAEKKEQLERVREENRQGQARVDELDEAIAATEVRERSRNTVLPNLARGYQAQAEPIPPAPKRTVPKSSRAFIAAFIGSAIGAAVVNVIFWIIFLVKYAK